jgi:hypothetical protein
VEGAVEIAGTVDQQEGWGHGAVLGVGCVF